MLNKIFKSNKKSENPGVKKLSVLLVNKVGLTDEAFNILFSPFIERLVLSNKAEQIITSTESLLSDGYFNQKGKKPSFFILFCLFCAEVYLIDDVNEFCPFSGDGDIPEISKCVVFYFILTSSEEGYKWAISNPDLLSEAWKYLKNGSGKYKSLLKGVLHAELYKSDNEDEDEDEDEMDFDSSDSSEIASLFDAVDAADSVESLLDEVSDSSNDSTDSSNDSTESLLDEEDDSHDLVDITDMLKQSD
jgi:hypothetical protein